MSQAATLQREQKTDLYRLLEKEVRKDSNLSGAILFLYCAGDSPGFEGMIKGFFNPLSGVNGQVMKAPVANTFAVLLPGLTLDAAHYQALLLKQHLLDMNAAADPRISLSLMSSVKSAQLLKQMAESARLSDSSDIHIFTEEEAADTSRILIVDHDATVREFLQIRLAMQGYEILEAVDGLEALEMIPKWEPDLVLTELNLYGIDGLPFIHHIQRLDVKEPPKIVVLTEKRVEQTISQCFQSGVDDYVTKPFSPVELDARIRRCLH